MFIVEFQQYACTFYHKNSLLQRISLNFMNFYLDFTLDFILQDNKILYKMIKIIFMIIIIKSKDFVQNEERKQKEKNRKEKIGTAK